LYGEKTAEDGLLGVALFAEEDLCQRKYRVALCFVEAESEGVRVGV
jgi:hypothetical protein